MTPRRGVLLLALGPLLVALLALPSGAAEAVRSPGTLDVHDTLDRREEWWAEQQSKARIVRRTVRARPTTRGSELEYAPDSEVLRTCSARLCVHHTTSGQHASTQAWADRALQHLERSWTRLVDELGFRPPAADGTQGGDDRFDVYLADTSARGQYGYCHPEVLVRGQTHRSTTYCVLDNDMTPFPGNPDDHLAVTAAHEFFHAVQFNTDVAEDRWFMEATATWAESQVFPRLRANREFLADGQLGHPARPLDSQGGMYGNWLFLHWLTQRHGTHAVRDVWQRLDATTGRPNEWSLQGVARYMARRGDTWRQAYRDFALANAVPGRHRGAGGLARGRSNVPRTTLRLRRANSDHRRTFTLDHLTSRSAVVRTARRPGHPRVQVSVRTGSPRQVRVAVVLERRNGSRTTRLLTPGPRGRAIVRYRHAKVKRAIVVVVNTSRAFRDCLGASGWACGGQPVHDGVRARLRVRLVR